MPKLEVLIDAARIHRRVQELAADLESQLGENPSGAPILFVGVLKGAYIFLADLARAMRSPVQIDFVQVSSYGASTESSGEPQLVRDIALDLTERHVVIVEDIVDTGITLAYLQKLFTGRGATSVSIAAILDKPERRKVLVKVDHIGFAIPDKFVVGYGLDYAEDYRNLPDICVLEP